jgi:uncharacterized protein (TIGR03435 family)
MKDDAVLRRAPVGLFFAAGICHSSGGAKLPARSATVWEFTSLPQRAALTRPVIDQTGTSGRYDFDLEFLPDEGQFGRADWKSDAKRGR